MQTFWVSHNRPHNYYNSVASIQQCDIKINFENQSAINYVYITGLDAFRSYAALLRRLSAKKLDTHNLYELCCYILLQSVSDLRQIDLAKKYK